MGFSEKTKNELARIMPETTCCRIAELTAFYDLNGYLMGKEGNYLDFTHSSPLVARNVLSLIRSIFPDVPTQTLVQKARIRKNQVCAIRVLGKEAAQLVYNSFMNQAYTNAELKILENDCCRRGYLRGSFISHGSITNPEKTYHLEFFTEKREVAYRILGTINSFGLSSNITMRKGNYLVYLKDGDQISTLLNLMGAHTSLLEFENIRVMKDMRNQVNRLVNCETANVDKTIKAAMNQIEMIEYIDAHLDLSTLPPKLYQTAKLRLENPYASLKELGELFEPPLSKSGINHRMRQLEQTYQRLQKEQIAD
ncbi:MAG: DNA-binding protein WhiA [Firmicutes bacterium]|nr:DNA-binding protein WhiA [Bacillota bacterium]